MARLRSAPPPRPGSIPPALTSMHDPTWKDAAAVEHLVAACGIDLRLVNYGGRIPDAPWWARFDAFRHAWCTANGYMNPRWDNTLDYARMREAGIDDEATSRYRLGHE